MNVTSKLRTPLMATVATLAFAPALGCAEDSEGAEGTLRVRAYGEEYIEEGIPSDVFVDGWEVVFSSFVVSLSDVEAQGDELDGGYVMDLSKSSGGTGHALGEFLTPLGELETIAYRIGPARADAGGNAAAADRDAMAAAGESMRVRGQLSRLGTVIDFDWGFTSDVRYVDCETEPTVDDAGAATSQITIHADHLFYDDLDSEEPNVAADLIAGADIDGDGTVTSDELKLTSILAQSRYQVGGRDITTLWDFIVAQTGTVGHIDGEGHCNTGP